jgi:S-DNA-T family DNA segregation ATPase FtsK/SpoIIIE
LEVFVQVANKSKADRNNKKVQGKKRHLKLAPKNEPKNDSVRKSKDHKVKRDIIAVLVLMTGILLFVGLYMQEKVGVFGDITSHLLGGLFGWPAVFLPILLIVYSLRTLFTKDPEAGFEGLILFLVFLILLSAMVQTSYYASNRDEFYQMSFGAKVERFYNNGTRLAGGGAVGSLVAMPLISVFQTFGTIVVLTALLLITVIYITDMTILEFFQTVFELIKRGIIGIVRGIRRAKMKRKERRQMKEAEEHKEPKEPKKPIPKLEGFEKTEESKTPVKGAFNIRILDSIRSSDFLDEEADSEPEPEAPKAEPILPKPKPSVVPVKEEKPIKSQSINILLPEKEQPKESVRQKLPEKPVEKPTENSVELKGTFYQYEYPKASLLKDPPPPRKDKDEKDVTLLQAAKLIETLKSFGVEAAVSTITKGPAIIRYELKPEAGIRAKRFTDLADDIALNLAARSVRVEAPIPGKDAIGIEIPKSKVTPVYFKEMITSTEFIKHPSKAAMVLGKDISGNVIIADITKMPHLLVAGATGSGKSVCINSLIMSILFKASPEDVRLLMIDPKMVELSRYNGIPHLLIPVVTDPKKAAGALRWVVQEMLDRYNLFYEKKVVDIDSYNELVANTGTAEKLPLIVIIIDELADLMAVARNEVEDSIQRLAQMARAAGMHLVIATQRPSVNVITGVIKANIPSRISFAVSSPQDSRTILDKGGAEKLLGRGDMLYHPAGELVPIRVQGTFVSNEEVASIVSFVKSNAPADYNEDIMEKIENDSESIGEEDSAGDADELLNEAIELVVSHGQASTSYIQRKLSIGYARAGRIIDQMEARGIISGYEGSKPRQVLISKEEWNEMKMKDGLPSVKNVNSGLFGKQK